MLKNSGSMVVAMILMDELRVAPNAHLHKMANDIYECFEILGSCLDLLERASSSAGGRIKEMRTMQDRREANYIVGMKDLLSSGGSSECVNAKRGGVL